MPESLGEMPSEHEPGDVQNSMSDEYLEKLYLFKTFKTATLETVGGLSSCGSAPPSSTSESHYFSSQDTLATMEGEPEEAIGSRPRAPWQQQKVTAPWGMHALFAMGYNVKEVIACCEDNVVIVRRFETGTDNHSVAVKCLSTRNQDRRDSIQKEYAILSQMSHDSIVKAVALHQSRFDMWLCMEYCQGTVAAHVREHGPIRQDSEEVRLLGELAEGVGYLHTLGAVAHRDLQPSSLLLRRTEAGLRLRIGGFGRARPLAGRVVLGAGISPGLYSAPEVWLNHTGMEETADIWSLGMCLCFMLLGEPGLPVRLEGSVAINCLLTLGLPKESWPGVSPGLEQLLRKCLAPYPNGRPDASDLLTEAEFPCKFSRRSP